MELSLVVVGIIALIILVAFIEWKIGTAIGKAVTQGVGLALGIVLIFLGVTIFIAIPIIMYSSKNKSDGKPLNLPAANLNLNLNKTDVSLNGQNETNNLSKFIGKNYKDILQENGLSEYTGLFENNKLTSISIISSLSENDLEKLGVTIMGDRKLILKIFSAS
jgi:hypothetical protein